jgi:hypothetical protein
MMPTEFPSGSSTMAYRAPQNASSDALWLRCPAAITRAWTRSTSSRDETWKMGITAEPSFASSRPGFRCFTNATLSSSTRTPFDATPVHVVTCPLGPLWTPRVLDGHAEQAIERDRPLHVADDHVDLRQGDRRDGLRHPGEPTRAEERGRPSDGTLAPCDRGPDRRRTEVEGARLLVRSGTSGAASRAGCTATAADDDLRTLAAGTSLRWRGILSRQHEEEDDQRDETVTGAP